MFHALHIEHRLLGIARRRTCGTGVGRLARDLYLVADMVLEFGCIARELIARSVVSGEYIVALRTREAPFDCHVPRGSCGTLRWLRLWVSLRLDPRSRYQ